MIKKTEVILPGSEILYADETTIKDRCSCSAVIYTTKDKNGEIVPIHKTANGFARHYNSCPHGIKKYKKRK